MKPTDNRQNKFIQLKAQQDYFKKSHPGGEKFADEALPLGVGKGGAVFGLVSNILLATKIAQSAKHCHLGIHNFDKAEPLLEHAKTKPPLLVILDWDGCEAEAFKVLKAFAAHADLKHIPTAGYLSHLKTDLKGEAQRAGCLHVYSRSEFTRELDDLLIRYAK